MANTNETLTLLAKKGFLVDRDSLDLLSKIGDVKKVEEIANRLFTVTKSRVLSRKLLISHFNEIKDIFVKQSDERDKNILDFFNEAEAHGVLKTLEKPLPSSISSELRKSADMKVLSSNMIPYRRIEVKDFVMHFKNRYNFFKNILQDRKELSNLISINKIGTNRNFSIIGLVRTKRLTKNKNFILEVEDLTGKIEVVIFPNLLDRNPVALQENKIVFIAGRVDDRNGEIKIVADDAQEIVVSKAA